MMLAHGPMMYAGGGFPWGLLIIGGILYLLWRNGMFDRGGRFGHGPRYGGGYGPGYPPAPMPPSGPELVDNPIFGGPRAMFDEWHRQAHEAERAAAQAPVAPPVPPAPTAPSANDAPRPGSDQPVG
jgi:hypothetical protein